MRLDEITREVLPAEVSRKVTMRLDQNWRGARLYIPSPSRNRRDGAPERFALELRAAIVDAGGTPSQADEILTALSGGYVWM